MTKNDVLAALRKSIPGQADYGQIDYSRLASADRICLLKQVEVSCDKNEPSFDITKNVRLGMEQW